MKRAVANKGGATLRAKAPEAISAPARVADSEQVASSYCDVVPSLGIPFSQVSVLPGGDAPVQREATVEGEAEEKQQEMGAAAVQLKSERAGVSSEEEPTDEENDVLRAKLLPALTSASPYAAAKGLRLGKPNDRFEREADATADAVMRMPDPASEREAQEEDNQSPEVQASPMEPVVQRAGSPATEEEEEVAQAQHKATGAILQRQEERGEDDERDDTIRAKGEAGRDEEERASVQAKSLGGGGQVPASVQQTMRGSHGAPLPDETRSFFEPRFSRDFSTIRVHTDGPAVSAAASLRAQAFTYKRDIYFNAGRYQPSTGSGRRLLAHELAHTIQQGAARPLQQSRPLAVGDSTGHERPLARFTPIGPSVMRQAVAEMPSPTAAPDTTTPAGIEVTLGAAANQDQAVELSAVEPEPPQVGGGADAEGLSPSPKRTEPSEAKTPEVAAPEASKEVAEARQGAAPKAAEGEAAPGPAGEEKGEAEAEAPLAENPAGLLTAITSAPATQSLGIYNRALAGSTAVLENERKGTEAALPRVPAPTGLVARREKPKEKGLGAVQKRTAPGRFTAEQGGRQGSGTDAALRPQRIEAKQRFGRTDRFVDAAKNREGGDPRSAEAALNSVHLNTNQIPDRLGPRPSVALEGKANPAQIEGYQGESGRLVADARGESLAQSKRDFGEKGIFPKPDPTVLASKRKLTAQGVTATTLTGSQTVPTEVQADIDQTMGARLGPALAEEQARYAEAQTQYEADKAKAEEDTAAQADALNQGTEARQQAERAKARSQVAGFRKEWQGEIDRVDKEFKEKSAKATEKERGAIEARRQRGEREAANKFDQAEDEARRKKREAERDTARAKSKAKSESKGFLGWLGSKIAGFFEGIKRAINTIFDKLKAAVQFVFEQAKKATLAVIDTARRAIVGLIKGLGTVLKGFVSIAFAAFPNIADKINAKIDGAVASATKAVNDAADRLKKGVTKLLDALASVINGLLSAVQAAYNFALTAMNLLVRGEFAELGRYIVRSALKMIGATLGALMQALGIKEEDVEKIIDNPVGFLGNLVSAVKQGLFNFRNNIVKHLTGGLIGWLFGTFASAGIKLPKSFSLSGIFSFVAQILGVTYQALRTRLVKMLGPKGEAMVSAVEKGFQFVKDFITKGPIVLWERVQTFLGNLKDLIFGSLIEWLRNTIIVKAITKLVTFFNPAGAIVQAIQAIYNVAMFFRERWEQIKSFAQSVFNSIKTIATGNVGAAAAFVEQSLARTIPIIISFLARLIGLGGIAERVKKVIAKVKKPIDRAVGEVLDWLVGVAKKIWAKLKGVFGRDKSNGKPKNKAERDRMVKAGLAALHREETKVDQDRDKKLTREQSRTVAERTRKRYPVFSSLEAVDAGRRWDYRYSASPIKTERGALQKAGADDVLQVDKHKIEVAGHNNRESHHVPENQLMKTLTSMYENAASMLKGEREMPVLSASLSDRAKHIRERFPEGRNLSAISLHTETHRGPEGVHRSSIQGDVLAGFVAAVGDMRNEDTKPRVVASTKSGKRLVAQLEDKHWQAIIAKAISLEMGEIRHSENELVITVKGDKNGVEQALRGAIDHAKEQSKIESKKKKLKNRINLEVLMERATSRVFWDALDKGLTAVKTALDRGKQTMRDGDSALFERRLHELRALARRVWFGGRIVGRFRELPTE